MKDYTNTEKRIRDLVPRLRELRLGCGVSWTEKGKTTRGIVIRVSEDGDTFELDNRRVASLSYLAYAKKKHRPEDFDYEIIGHPITLEDILEAFPKLCFKDGHLWEGFKKSKNKSPVVPEEPRCEIMEFGVTWTPGKDFSQQSQECQEFIAHC